VVPLPGLQMLLRLRVTLTLDFLTPFVFIPPQITRARPRAGLVWR